MLALEQETGKKLAVQARNAVSKLWAEKSVRQKYQMN